MKTHRKKGFTIVELVIVIAVIAILAAVLIPTFSNVISKAQESNALQAARSSWNAYIAEHAQDFTGKDAYIKVTTGDKDYWFKAEKGQFSTTIVTPKPNVSTSYKIVWNGSTEGGKVNTETTTGSTQPTEMIEGLLNNVSIYVSTK